MVTPDPHPSRSYRSAGLDERLLGGRRRYRRHEVADAAGVDVAYARRLWRAMGFANVGDEAEAFTDGDVEALRRVVGLVTGGVIDDELAVSFTRAMGHTTARLVEWQVEALEEYLRFARGLPGRDAMEAGIELADEHLLDFERLLVYVWRRQLAAVSGRALHPVSGEAAAGWMCVGFADMVSFTRLSQRLAERDLAALVDRFEHTAADIIAAGGGRLVKTIGDEVLFVAADAPRGAEIALQLVEAMAADEVLPELRIGLASGTVVSRMGDVFGPTVNLASRLTALAEPGTVLVEEATEQALSGQVAYLVDPGRTRDVRGVGHVRTGVLLRADDAGASTG